MTIRVSLASRSPRQLDQVEAAMRLVFDVPGPAEKGPSRNGKHRRFLTVHPARPTAGGIPVYVPTAADVTAAFAAAAREQDRPQNLTDLSIWIAHAVGIAWRQDRPVVSQRQLRAILDEMVGSGEVLLLRGSQWETDHGVKFLHQRPSGWYYALPADAKRWDQAALARLEQQLEKQARQEALLVLRDRHQEEYAQIVQWCAGRLRAQPASP